MALIFSAIIFIFMWLGWDVLSIPDPVIIVVLGFTFHLKAIACSSTAALVYSRMRDGKSRR